MKSSGGSGKGRGSLSRREPSQSRRLAGPRNAVTGGREASPAERLRRLEVGRAVGYSGAMDAVFSQQRASFRGGLCSLVLSSAMGAGSLYLVLFVVLREYVWVLAAVLFPGYAFFISFSLVAVLLYLRESIAVDGDEVRFTNIVGGRTASLSDVRRAVWRLPHSPRLVLVFADGKQEIWFASYRPDHRRQLISLFHERIRPEVQEGWNEHFDVYVANVERANSPESRSAQLKQVAKGALASSLLGPPCGLFLHWYAARLGVAGELSFSGSLVVDWAVVGILAGAGAVALTWALLQFGKSDSY